MNNFSSPETRLRSSKPSFRSRTRLMAAVAIDEKNAKLNMSPGAMNSVTVGSSLPSIGGRI